jgi:hypothetical protein
MVAIIIGLFFVVMSIIMTVRTKNADARRTALMKRISPINNHPGVILYAKISRHVGSVLIFAAGVLCLLGGLGFFSD